MRDHEGEGTFTSLLMDDRIAYIEKDITCDTLLAMQVVLDEFKGLVFNALQGV